MYTKEKQWLRQKGKDSITIEELPSKRRGKPYLLGDEMEMQVRAYLTALRANGAVVNTAIAIGCVEGIVRSKEGVFLQSMVVT